MELHPPSETCTLNSMYQRHRRIRNNAILRDLVAQHQVSVNDLVMPLFLKEGLSKPIPIESMPGQFQHNLESLLNCIELALKRGVRSFILFGIPTIKSPDGNSAWQPDGFLPIAIRAVKKRFLQINLIADVCLCEYTSHGHCGVLEQNQIHNDKTLNLLAKIALCYAQAGADVIAPSDMMDGRVQVIRNVLDHSQFEQLPICSYAVKFASPLYAPFRDAAENAPQGPDRSSYQMDARNSKEAISEALSDISEGADMILIKPAMPYLDIVSSVARTVQVPIGVYQVSGEYSMVKAAAEKGWIDEQKIVNESLIAAKRAGASFIITYWAMEFASWPH